MPTRRRVPSRRPVAAIESRCDCVERKGVGSATVICAMGDGLALNPRRCTRVVRTFGVERPAAAAQSGAMGGSFDQAGVPRR